MEKPKVPGRFGRHLSRAMLLGFFDVEVPDKGGPDIAVNRKMATAQPAPELHELCHR